MNSVNLMGRICNYPELKNTTSGVSVTTFTLAVDRAFIPKGGEKQTDFITCVAWRNTAEFISKYFKKGQRMAISGELQTRQYTASDGGQRKVYEVVVNNAFFCESKGDAMPSIDVEPSAEFKTAVQGGWEEIPLTDEDLPF